ncbi:zinc carboxypeptidase A 1-like, partial [Manduca sexta]|uniref:zinc carboxypeptidase A 1-like n=1 Tax=Manduca sexta TaxID=7130 RepID=UPI00189033FE
MEFENLNVNVLIEDYSKIINEEKLSLNRKLGFSWTAYHDVNDIYKYLEDVNKAHSDWTEVIVGGESYEGRKIQGIRINTPTGDENKPVIFIESGLYSLYSTYFEKQTATTQGSRQGGQGGAPALPPLEILKKLPNISNQSSKSLTVETRMNSPIPFLIFSTLNYALFYVIVKAESWSGEEHVLSSL